MYHLQSVLGQMLSIPDADASRELLEAYLKLLSEAYQSTCNLARSLQVSITSAKEIPFKLKTRQHPLANHVSDSYELD